MTAILYSAVCGVIAGLTHNLALWIHPVRYRHLVEPRGAMHKVYCVCSADMRHK